MAEISVKELLQRLRATGRMGLTVLFCSAVMVTVASFAIIPSTKGQKRRVVNANDYPGGDLGSKINAADQALGTARGEIVVRGGGTISTQVIISSDHILRLLPGTYTTDTAKIPFLMKSGSSIVGAGWESIIMESTAPGQFTVIMAYNQSTLNGKPDSNLVIRDLQIKGANPRFHSAPQAISLGNCSGCLVEKVWVNATRSIGIQLGGSSSTGHFADNSKVINCLFTRVASQNLALVNGRNILFEGNRFIKSGQKRGPGNTNIDLETNEKNDHLEHVIIRNNFIDVRDSDHSPTGNGIVIQAASGTDHVGPILVENNTLIGGSNTGLIRNYMSNGIYVFGRMSNVTIRNNVITRTGQSGIRIEGRRISVVNNKLTDVGGATAGFIVRATDSQIIGNTFTWSRNQVADGRILVQPGSRNNVIQDNRGFRVVEGVR